MTEIMMSIQPKWVEKILQLEKRWELRKTMPKALFPFRVYIYQTDGGGVIGEFTCDGIYQIPADQIDKAFLKETCVSVNAAREYAAGKTLYKWRIRSLIDYPEPKPLSLYGLERAPQSWCYVRDGDSVG